MNNQTTPATASVPFNTLVSVQPGHPTARYAAEIMVESMRTSGDVTPQTLAQVAALLSAPSRG